MEMVESRENAIKLISFAGITTVVARIHSLLNTFLVVLYTQVAFFSHPAYNNNNNDDDNTKHSTRCTEHARKDVHLYTH